jgi:molybdate transport system substrate-binding protein
MRQGPGTRDIRRTGALFCAVALLTGLVACARPAAPPVRVAAAANLQAALSEIVDRFARDTGDRVDVVFGSSGLLSRQIQEGAPFELFLAADDASVERLHQEGRTRDAGVRYAVGRIAFFAPDGSVFRVEDGFEELRRLAAAGPLPPFAIANPDTAPYGRAAEQALRTHDLWDAVKPGLVVGENVAQAAQFASTGNAMGGIIAYSLALTPELRARGAHALIDQRDHAPITQRMALMKNAGPIAARFYDYLQTETTRTVLERHGFTRPDP